MLLSIKKIFFNLKLSLFILALGLSFLAVQVFYITQYSERLTALKNQHILIEKIVSINLNDLQMATIALNGHIAELSLSLKHSTNDAFLDTFLASDYDKTTLSNTLRASSSAFQDASLFWIESTPHGRATMHAQMISARNTYLVNISDMINYQIQLINQLISIIKETVIVLFLFSLIVFFMYSFRLKQIYRDINKACSLDTDGTKAEVTTQEINFIVKRLSRKSPLVNISQSMLHPQSGLNNEKGMLALYNAKRLTKGAGSIFITLFEIDNYAKLFNALSKEDMAGIYKKIADIIFMYEQPMDVIAHLDNNNLIFIMSRPSKDAALAEAEKILHSVHDSSFNTTKGPIKLTLSGSFSLKTPVSTLEVSILDAAKILTKAKESGGNRIAQLR
ncbi:MAG: hypothetical protein WC680_00700 [Sulfuricurvum sp.]|jgi:GGDEF domain-containing protein